MKLMLSRLLERWIATTVAGEGFTAGLVWRPTRDLRDGSGRVTGLLVMVDAEGKRFAVAAISDRAEGGTHLRKHDWAAEFAISPTASRAEADVLLPVLLRRLRATGRTEADDQRARGELRMPAARRRGIWRTCGGSPRAPASGD